MTENTRSIKFRAWDKFNQIMWGHEECYKNDLATFFREYQGALDGENEPVLMQFTGLLDKNGKEMFFQDLVKHEDSMGIRIGVVLWDEDFCHICIEFDDGKLKSRKYGGREMFEETEIVGNIYENPELLENK